MNTKMKKINELLILLLLPLLLSGCDSLSDGHEWDLTYIPVQIESGDPISLIDSRGEIVVKEEYNDENTVSIVFKGAGKLYWVGEKGKKQLYSIDHPKTPISSEEYDQVTYFVNNRAVVVREGEPIEIIDNKGKVVASLPKNIISASVFQGSGVSVINTTDNGMGWINKDGKIISQGYESVWAYNNGLIITRKEADGAFDIYSADGTKTGSIAKDMVVGAVDNFEPNILVYRQDEDEKITDCQVIDKTGKKKYDINVHFDKAPVFCDGFIIFEKDERFGVINNKGEEIIRAKYYFLNFRNENKQFIAQKTRDGDYGVINDKDETILPFDYKVVEPFGNNYLVKQEKRFNIIDKEGKELLEGGFKEVVDEGVQAQVRYFDVDGLAETVVSTIEKADFNMKPSQVAKMLNRDEPQKEVGSRFISDEDTEIMGLRTFASYSFEDNVAIPVTHYESGDKILDKFIWNDSTVLSRIFFAVYLEENSATSDETIFKAIKKEMEKKGYSYDDGLFTKGDRTARISLEGYPRKLEIAIEKTIKPEPAEAEEAVVEEVVAEAAEEVVAEEAP